MREADCWKIDERDKVCFGMLDVETKKIYSWIFDFVWAVSIIHFGRPGLGDQAEDSRTPECACALNGLVLSSFIAMFQKSHSEDKSV